MLGNLARWTTVRRPRALRFRTVVPNVQLLARAPPDHQHCWNAVWRAEDDDEGVQPMQPESEATTIGFVGLGAMGLALCQHLLASDRRVVGWDMRSEAVEALRGLGGVGAATLAEAAAAPIVISMVFDDAATLDVTFQDGGIAQSLAPGALHVVMATISPGLSRQLHDEHAARGQRYLAASVFGRPEAAQAGELIINCSGARTDYDEAVPAFRCFGVPTLVGDQPEQAMLLKVMGNNMIYAAAEMLREMFDLLRAGGIEPSVAKASLVDNLFPGFIYDGYARRIMEQPVRQKLNPIAGKDNMLCLEAGEQFGVSLPMVRFLREEIIGPLIEA